MNKRAEFMTNVEMYEPDIIAVTEVSTLISEEMLFMQMQSWNYMTMTVWRLAQKVEEYVCKKYPQCNSGGWASWWCFPMWCEIRLKNSYLLLFGCIYRSPNSTKENSRHLNNLLYKVCTRDVSHLIIVGDFNFPEVDWKTWTCNAGDSNPSYAFMECMLAE